MTKTGRYLFFIKLLGMLIGLIAAGLTVYIQHDAAERASSLICDATKFRVPLPKENASEIEKRAFYSDFVQSLIFEKVRDIENAVSKSSFAATLANYPPLKAGIILSAFLLFVGEFWQLHRTSSPNSSQTQALAPVPYSVTQKPGVEISAKTATATVEVKVTT